MGNYEFPERRSGLHPVEAIPANLRPLSKDACELSTTVTGTCAFCAATKAIPRPCRHKHHQPRPIEEISRGQLYHLARSHHSQPLDARGRDRSGGTERATGQLQGSKELPRRRWHRGGHRERVAEEAHGDDISRENAPGKFGCGKGRGAGIIDVISCCEPALKSRRVSRDARIGSATPASGFSQAVRLDGKSPSHGGRRDDQGQRGRSGSTRLHIQPRHRGMSLRPVMVRMQC
jgi:hypothetical protein